MAKPYIHAKSSARKYGGKPEDYLDIHNFLDSSKSSFPDNRHRALTHNSWFISTVIEKVYGSVAINSDGREYSPRQIAEDHVLEDYRMRFIPTAQDFLEGMEWKDWMNNGVSGCPSSHKKLNK